MIRKTILVVSNVSNGDTRSFDDVFKELGCNVIRSGIDTAVRSARIFMDEFSQGIPVAIVHGQTPRDASDIARHLKHAYRGIHVIAMSDQVVEPVREGGMEYDVIVPNRRSDLRNILETFLGFQEW